MAVSGERVYAAICKSSQFHPCVLAMIPRPGVMWVEFVVGCLLSPLFLNSNLISNLRVSGFSG